MKKMGYFFVKRLFDVVASVIAIVFFVIPWIVIAVIIKMQSPGPVLYKAKRVGKNGRVFVLYKFRSMRTDSGRIRATTLRNDSRIFPFGNFLRRTKLDETPQLINVLIGDMSVIGPRPEDEYNFEKLYCGRYRGIVSVKPGLSSPASLYDYTVGEKFENEQDYLRLFVPKKLEMELYYTNKCSFVYDLKIVVKTVFTIILTIVGYENFKEPKELMSIGKENGYVEQKIESDSVHAGR